MDAVLLASLTFFGLAGTVFLFVMIDVLLCREPEDYISCHAKFVQEWTQAVSMGNVEDVTTEGLKGCLGKAKHKQVEVNSEGSIKAKPRWWLFALTKSPSKR